MRHLEDPLSTLSRLQLDFLAKLARAAVRHVVVGGYAVRCHGHLRDTGDIDVLVDRSRETAQKVLEAFVAIGGRIPQQQFDLSQPRKKVTYRHSAGDIEVLSSMDGLDFDEVFQERLLVSAGDLRVPVISRPHLILAKRLALEDPERSEDAAVDRKDLDALLEGNPDGGST